MMILHQHPDNKSKAPPSSVKGHMRIYERTGVDASSTWIVDWKDVGTAVCTTSIETQMNLDRCVTVQMEGGELTVDCKWRCWSIKGAILQEAQTSAVHSPHFPTGRIYDHTQTF